MPLPISAILSQGPLALRRQELSSYSRQKGDVSAAPMIPSPKEPKEGNSLNPYMVSGIVGVGLRTVDVVVGNGWDNLTNHYMGRYSFKESVSKVRKEGYFCTLRPRWIERALIKTGAKMTAQPFFENKVEEARLVDSPFCGTILATMPSALVEVVLQHPLAEIRLFKLNQPEKTLLNAFTCEYESKGKGLFLRETFERFTFNYATVLGFNICFFGLNKLFSEQNKRKIEQDGVGYSPVMQRGVFPAISGVVAGGATALTEGLRTRSVINKEPSYSSVPSNIKDHPILRELSFIWDMLPKASKATLRVYAFIYDNLPRGMGLRGTRYALTGFLLAQTPFLTKSVLNTDKN